MVGGPCEMSRLDFGEWNLNFDRERWDFRLDVL